MQHNSFKATNATNTRNFLDQDHSGDALNDKSIILAGGPKNIKLQNLEGSTAQYQHWYKLHDIATGYTKSSI